MLLFSQYKYFKKPQRIHLLNPVFNIRKNLLWSIYRLASYPPKLWNGMDHLGRNDNTKAGDPRGDHISDQKQRASKKTHFCSQVLTQVAKQSNQCLFCPKPMYELQDLSSIRFWSSLGTSIFMACMWIPRGLREFIASMRTMGLSQVISSPTNIGGYSLDPISRCDYLQAKKQHSHFLKNWHTNFWEQENNLLELQKARSLKSDKELYSIRQLTLQLARL